MRSRSSRLHLSVLVLLVACAPAIRFDERLQAVLTERLYFGRRITNTLSVTDSAWGLFVKGVVSARLPQGFTYWAAEGEWRGADGESTREPSFVLEFVHPASSAEADSAVVVIITEYKRRFSQQSVLRVVTPGRASF